MSKFDQVKEMLDNIEKDYEQEIEDNLKVTEEGYNEAWKVINALRERQEKEREECEKALDEGFEEAYRMLLEERKRSATFELTFDDVLGAVARGYCHEKNSHKILDSDLCKAIAEEVWKTVSNMISSKARAILVPPLPVDNDPGTCHPTRAGTCYRRFKKESC